MINFLIKFTIILLTDLLIAATVLATENVPANLTSIENTSNEQGLVTKIPILPNYGFADIVEPIIPAVVNIYTVQYNQKLEDIHKKPFDQFPFDHFNELLERFNLPFDFEEMYSNPKSVPLGSGFIIDPSGFIVTNYHVIANSEEIYIKLTDNRELPAQLVGSDQKTDLAILKIESPTPLPFVEFGDSSKARVGDFVIAIGNPFGRLGGTVTSGIISSKGRDIDAGNGFVDDYIQTDAAINNGNSGGPMFNINGKVIGVNTAILSPFGTNIGIGFAIPSNTAKPIIDQLKQYGKINRGRLGVIIQEVTSDIAEGLGLEEPTGALVVEVQKDGPGNKFGIKPGDVIIEFAGIPVKNSKKLQVMVAETNTQQEVKIVVIRDGKKQELIAKISEEDLESDKINNQVKEKTNDNKIFIIKNNITFSNITESLKQKSAIKNKINGVVVTNIDKNSKSHGFKIGDVIIASNQQPIASVEQLNLLYENAQMANKKNIILLVQRGEKSIFIALPIDKLENKKSRNS